MAELQDWQKSKTSFVYILDDDVKKLEELLANYTYRQMQDIQNLILTLLLNRANHECIILQGERNDIESKGECGWKFNDFTPICAKCKGDVV